LLAFANVSAGLVSLAIRLLLAAALSPPSLLAGSARQPVG